MALDPIEARRIQRETYHEADVVVVGAGVFGCAAAYALAEQGRSVLLLERWMSEPDRIVGELLQPGGIQALKKLGLGHCVDDIDAVACHGYNVIYHGDEVLIPYPTMDDDGGVPHQWSGAGKEGKREVGKGFHHGRFIMQLRRACLAHRNITVRETEVVKTIRGEHTDHILGVETRTTTTTTTTTGRENGKGGDGGVTKKADYFFGQLTIIADGYDSKFRKEVTTAKALATSKFYALELKDTVLPAPGYGHVIIGNAFPILLYQIGARETRALFDVPHGIPEAAPAAGGVKNYLRHHAIPALPPAVRPAALAALDGGSKLRSMPNSWLPPTRQDPRGMVVLGDAINMRHPLTGAGMTVALNDAVLLAGLLAPDRVRSLDDEAAVRAAMRALHWRRKSYTSILNVLAQALYALFAASDPQLHALRMGCFEYFRRGVTDGPCGMLAGIIHRPVVLAYHFFSVAFVAIWMHFVETVTSGPGPLGVLKAPVAMLDAVLILAKACVVFLPLIWREGFR